MVTNLIDIIEGIDKNEPNEKIMDKMNEESEKSMGLLQEKFMAMLK